MSIREVTMIKNWLNDHKSLVSKKPFDELGKAITRALDDSVITGEERLDLLWLCSQAQDTSPYFCETTRRMQQLHGMMAMASSDGVLDKAELESISKWLEDNDDLNGLWPYSEIESLIVSVLEDGIIDSREHEILIIFFNSFAGLGPSHDKLPGELPVTLTGICAVAPDVVFKDKTFCFTGQSNQYTRTALSSEVENRGGTCLQAVSGKLNYLIVCDNGNKAWSFSAYGRKVEAAMQQRKKGANIVIVHEADFHDALIE